jgi:hypothetical protein
MTMIQEVGGHQIGNGDKGMDDGEGQVSEEEWTGDLISKSSRIIE